MRQLADHTCSLHPRGSHGSLAAGGDLTSGVLPRSQWRDRAGLAPASPLRGGVTI
ncbi:hypothetical protein BQ8420_16670 [Nocardiopsis sp. JB363]|nr:hypothetical protein BQ8420_16670 [Nocardiopsis sp. JB363]